MKKLNKEQNIKFEQFHESAQKGQWSKGTVLFFICAAGYLLLLLLTAGPINRLSWKLPQSWISKEINHLSDWLPVDWHLAPDNAISHQLTGFSQFLLLFCSTFLFYLLATLCIKNIKYAKQAPFIWIMRTIWLVTILAGLCYLTAPGSLSLDVISYECYGRILGIHHANPYFVTFSAFPQDPFYGAMYWKQTVSIYGPLWTLLSAAIAIIAGDNLDRAILIFRLIILLAHLINIWLIGRILKDLGRSSPTIVLGSLLYAWNPLVLLESANGAHNDILMLTLLLAGCWFGVKALDRKNGFAQTTLKLTEPYLWLTGLTLTLAALIKFSALPMLAFFIFAIGSRILQTSPEYTARNWLKALQVILIIGGSCIGIAIASYLPFWWHHSLNAIIQSFSALPFQQQVLNSTMYTFVLLQDAHWLPGPLIWLATRGCWNLINIVALGSAIMGGGLLIWRQPTIRSVILSSAILFCAFQFGTTWFFPWYATWLVALSVLILPVEKHKYTAMLTTWIILFSLVVVTLYYSTSVDWLILETKQSFELPDWKLWAGIITLIVPIMGSLGTGLFWSLKKGKTHQPQS